MGLEFSQITSDPSKGLTIVWMSSFTLDSNRDAIPLKHPLDRSKRDQSWHVGLQPFTRGELSAVVVPTEEIARSTHDGPFFVGELWGVLAEIVEHVLGYRTLIYLESVVFGTRGSCLFLTDWTGKLDMSAQSRKEIEGSLLDPLPSRWRIEQPQQP